jgi:DnaJ-class molecular chaperone
MTLDENYFQEKAKKHVEMEKLARKILGLTDGANAIEIKKSYWLLAMKYHPDKNPDDAEAKRKYKNMQNAYEFLIKGKINDDLNNDNNFEESISEEYDTSNSWGYYLWWKDKYFK